MSAARSDPAHRRADRADVGDQTPAKADAGAALELVRAVGALLRVPLAIDQSVVAAHLHPGAARPSGSPSAARRSASSASCTPRIAAAYDLGGDVAIVELDAGALLDAMPGRPQYRPFATFPPVTQDLAVVVDAEIPRSRSSTPRAPAARRSCAT